MIRICFKLRCFKSKQQKSNREIQSTLATYFVDFYINILQKILKYLTLAGLNLVKKTYISCAKGCRVKGQTKRGDYVHAKILSVIETGAQTHWLAGIPLDWHRQWLHGLRGSVQSSSSTSDYRQVSLIFFSPSWIQLIVFTTLKVW